MAVREGILGAILAGGQSRRMGGGDKALADLAGLPMAEHVVSRLTPQLDRLVLNANGPGERFAALGLPVVPDADFAGSGPLAGVLAVMAWAGTQPQAVHHILTVTADCPYLPADLVQRLTAAAGARVPVVAESGGRWHATIALWPMSLRPAVAQALHEGRRSVEAFAREQGAIVVSFPSGMIAGQPVDPFFNVNTPEDLATARALLARRT